MIGRGDVVVVMTTQKAFRVAAKLQRAIKAYRAEGVPAEETRDLRDHLAAITAALDTTKGDRK